MRARSTLLGATAHTPRVSAANQRQQSAAARGVRRAAPGSPRAARTLADFLARAHARFLVRGTNYYIIRSLFLDLHAPDAKLPVVHGRLILRERRRLLRLLRGHGRAGGIRVGSRKIWVIRVRLVCFYAQRPQRVCCARWALDRSRLGAV